MDVEIKRDLIQYLRMSGFIKCLLNSISSWSLSFYEVAAQSADCSLIGCENNWFCDSCRKLLIKWLIGVNENEMFSQMFLTSAGMSALLSGRNFHPIVEVLLWAMQQTGTPEQCPVLVALVFSLSRRLRSRPRLLHHLLRCLQGRSNFTPKLPHILLSSLH